MREEETSSQPVVGAVAGDGLVSRQELFVDLGATKLADQTGVVDTLVVVGFHRPRRHRLSAISVVSVARRSLK